VLIDQLLSLKKRNPHFDAQIFDFLAAGDDAASLLLNTANRFADQIRPEHPLTGNVKIVAIDECEQRLHYTG